MERRNKVHELPATANSSTKMAKKEKDKRKEPRFYMELALEVMKKSVDELKKDTPCPRVVQDRH